MLLVGTVYTYIYIYTGCKITHELRFGLRVVHDTWKSQELNIVHDDLIVKWPREYIFDTVRHFYP